MTDTRYAAVRAANARRSEARHRAVITAAMADARDNGFQWITRNSVAYRAGVSPASVSHSFGTMIDLKRAVLREAVRCEDLTIIAQGLAEKHPIIMEEASPGLRERAARSMVA